MEASDFGAVTGGGSPRTAHFPQIEPLTDSNIGGAAALCRSFFDETHFNGRVEFSLAGCAHHLALFTQRDSARGWVAQLPGSQEVVGFLLANLATPWFSSTQVCFEQGFYVAPKARATGVGRMLLTHLESWADINGATYLQVAVTSGIDNAAVDDFLKGRDYAPMGRAYWKEF